MHRPFSENAMQHQPRIARFSYQLSVISYQLSVISYQLSVISYQLSVISYQKAEGRRQKAEGRRQKAERAMDGVPYIIDTCTAGELFLGVVHLLQILPLSCVGEPVPVRSNVRSAVSISVSSPESISCSAVSKRVHEPLAIAPATAFLPNYVIRPRCSHATRSALLR
jgi:hypothetical protein